tara:strand:+ start:201 stop:626 length:426 start_codon:yes stop_codon:yes gene_type:complete
MKFNARNIDTSTLLPRAKKEAKAIFKSDSSRRGRTYKKILEDTLYGHVSELYLIQEHQFKDDPKSFKDLFDPEGNAVEVKTTQFKHYVPSVLDRAADVKKNQTWRNFPDILYVFVGDKSTLEYNLDGIYKWGRTKFVLQNV